METQSELLLLIWFWIILGGCAEKTTKVWLDDLKIKSFSEGIPAVLPKTTAAGDSIKMNGIYFDRGIGVQTISVLSFFLNENASRFTAEVGADDCGNKDVSVKFFVIGDRKILFESGEMQVGNAPKKVSVNLKGIKRLGLLVTDDVEGHNKTYSNWANAQLEMVGNTVPEQIPNSDVKHILTPLPELSPKINSAKIFGATPGNPFLYTIAATGNRPMEFSAENLPKGLKLDAKTGIITGKKQYSHVSLFSLLAAPLLIGCPIEQLDDFTLILLTNDEVIEINQDPLGNDLFSEA